MQQDKKQSGQLYLVCGHVTQSLWTYYMGFSLSLHGMSSL
jgi:hypothetical protein